MADLLRPIDSNDWVGSGATYGTQQQQGSVQIGAGANQAGLTNLAGAVVLYAGSSTPANAPWRVLSDGTMYATKAIISTLLANGFEVWDDDLSSQVTGSATSFTTTQPYYAGTLQVIRNGLWLKGGGTDFTEGGGSTGIFTMAAAPATNTVFRVNYRIAANSTEVYNETPTPACDGVTTVFTTTYTYTENSLQVFRNGLTLDRGTDYNEGGAFTMTVAPVANSKILCAYRVNHDANWAFQETPTGSVNGVNAVFTFANAYTAGTIIVAVNGLIRFKTIDYTESAANQITFTVAPLTGSTVLIASYRKA